MKKTAGVLLCILLVVFSLTACAKEPKLKPLNKPDDNASAVDVPETTANVANNQETPQQTLDEEELALIELSFEIDAPMEQAIVHVTNKSQSVFSGDIHVYLKNQAGRNAGRDMIIVDELGPGGTTWARIAILETDDLVLDYTFADNCAFSDSAITQDATVDQVASSSLTEEMLGSFGGAGNPEYATSWYADIVKIEVFSTSSNENYAVVTVETEDNAKKIADIVFGNFARNFSLVTVSAISQDGSELYTRS